MYRYDGPFCFPFSCLAMNIKCSPSLMNDHLTAQADIYVASCCRRCLLDVSKLCLLLLPPLLTYHRSFPRATLMSGFLKSRSAFLGVLK